MTFPPAEVSSLPLGVDVYAGNTYKGAAINAAGFTNLRDHGKTFAILKSSQGTQPDGQFSAYYALAQNSGLIRGSYHFYANPQGTLPFHSGTVQQQADLVVSLVNRLVPGDLAPALDLEDEPRGASNRYPLDQGIQPTENGYHYRHIAAYADHGRAGLDALLTDVGEFMFRLETALGRPPLIYTSVMWMDSDMMNNPTAMFKFPLWTVNHGRTALLRDIQVGGWGSNWTFMQYAEDGKNYPHWGTNNYQEPGIDIPGCDFNAFNGTLYELRGLADIGRPGVAVEPSFAYITNWEVDGGLSLISGSATWTEASLAQTGAPLSSGDPAIIALPGSLFVYFRSGNELIETTAMLSTVDASWSWQSNSIQDVTPIYDPRVAAAGTSRYVVYWGEDDDWHLLMWNGGWSSAGGVLNQAGVKTAQGQGRSTGQPVVYVAQGFIHVVGRVDTGGHLVDVWFDGTWKSDDITALALDLAPNLPPATFSPSVYESATGVGIVFRGVGGELWNISRSDNAPTNLTATTQAMPAVGHPTSFVVNQQPHIVYRGTDRLIYDIWSDGTSWRVTQVCTEFAAADPVAAVDGTTGMVAVRMTNGIVYVAQLVDATWTCGPTVNAS